MTAPAVWDGDLLLAVREHASAQIADAEQEAREATRKARAAYNRAARLKALLAAAEEDV